MSVNGATTLTDDCYNEEVIIDIEAIAALACDDEIDIDIEAIAAQTRLEEIQLKFESGLYLYKSDILQYFAVRDEIALLIGAYFDKSALNAEEALKALKVATIHHEQYHNDLSRREKYFSTCMLKYHMNQTLARFRSKPQDCNQQPVAHQSASPSFITRTFERHRDTTTTSYYSSSKTSNSQQDSACKEKYRRTL